MDAFDLAKQYRDWMEEAWKGLEREPGDLCTSFQDWHDEVDLIRRTGDDYTLALQTWIVVSAWFAQRPEDFAAIRASVTMPMEFSDWPAADLPYHQRAKLQGLPGILDPVWWRYEVFERQSGRRR